MDSPYIKHNDSDDSKLLIRTHLWKNFLADSSSLEDGLYLVLLITYLRILDPSFSFFSRLQLNSLSGNHLKQAVIRGRTEE